MHPTPPGPLGDCLRDWEELQQDFQSIQVSDHAGGRPLAPSPVSLAGGHWSGRGMSGRGEQRSGVGDPGVVPEGGEARDPGVPPGLSSRPHVSVRRRHTSPARPRRPRRTPLRPWDLGPPARASERDPDPNLAFLQKNGRSSQSWPGPVLGQSLSKHAVGAARPEPRVVPSRPLGSTSGPSAPGVHPGRQSGLGQGSGV